MNARVVSSERRVASHQGIRDWGLARRRKAEGGRRNSSFILHPSSFPPTPNPQSPISSSFILHPLSPRPTPLAPRPFGFTLVELLITITIISILAGLSLGALRWARTAAAEAKTKATIAKLNHIIMKQYESYMTRRVPIDIQNFPPKVAAEYRLFAIRDLMRMEMPERLNDIFGFSSYSSLDNDDEPSNIPLDIPVDTWPWPTGTTYSPPGATDPIYWVVTLPNGTQIRTIPAKLSCPAITQAYWKHKSGISEKYSSAELLYMIVSLGNPGPLEQFRQDEIGDKDHDGFPEFIDGWGMPIQFLRWAPGFISPNSEIQTGNYTTDHDPFDTRNIRPNDYHLIPLIYSAGPDKEYGLILDSSSGKPYHYNGDPYDQSQIGHYVGEPDGNTHIDNIHNHYIEQQ